MTFKKYILRYLLFEESKSAIFHCSLIGDRSIKVYRGTFQHIPFTKTHYPSHEHNSSQTLVTP